MKILQPSNPPKRTDVIARSAATRQPLSDYRNASRRSATPSRGCRALRARNDIGSFGRVRWPNTQFSACGNLSGDRQLLPQHIFILIRIAGLAPAALPPLDSLAVQSSAMPPPVPQQRWQQTARPNPPVALCKRNGSATEP